MNVFYRRHLCRVDPWPADVLKSFKWMEKNHTGLLHHVSLGKLISQAGDPLTHTQL